MVQRCRIGNLATAMKRVRVTFEVSVKNAKPGDKVFVVGGITWLGKCVNMSHMNSTLMESQVVGGIGISVFDIIYSNYF